MRSRVARKGAGTQALGETFFQDPLRGKRSGACKLFPGRGNPCKLRLPVPQQQLQLMGSQPLYRAGRVLRPPGEVPFRKSFLTGPKTLPVIDKDLQRRGAPVTKDEQPPAERIAAQPRAAYSGQSIDAVSEIHRLHGQQDPHLRGDLDHVPQLHNPRSRSSICPTPAPFSRILMRIPRAPIRTFS